MGCVFSWEVVVDEVNHTVDGRNPANQVVDSLSHVLQGFIHPRWCRISINSSFIFKNFWANVS